MSASQAPPTADGTREPSPRWVLPRVLVAALAVAYLTSIAALMAYAVVPMLFGWSTYVVQSESMAPAVRAGDALVSSSIVRSELERGQVVVIDDPAVDGRLLSHRVVAIRADGSLVTRGDANQQADSTPVQPDRVRGVARLRVPFVGLPRTWVNEGSFGWFAVWSSVTIIAVVAAVTDPARRGRPRRRQPPQVWRRPPRRRVALSMGRPTAMLLVLATTSALTASSQARPVHAAFAASTANSGNSFAARPDFVAPTASATVVSKYPAGYLTGSVRPSAAYRVYAQVTDTGNPASGVASVVAAATIGSVGLSTSSATVGGVSYNYESASVTAGATSTVPYDLVLDDNSGNSRTQTGYSFTIEGTAPTATDVQGINKTGGVPGLPEAGDILRLTTSERIDPYSVVSGWTGTASTPVTVRMDGTGPSTVITVRSSDNSVQLPWGQVTTPNQYTNGVVDFTGSTMVQVVSNNRNNITLGTPSAALSTVNVNATLQWTPVATPFDAAGNVMTTAARNETGAADSDF